MNEERAHDASSRCVRQVFVLLKVGGEPDHGRSIIGSASSGTELHHERPTASSHRLTWTMTFAMLDVMGNPLMFSSPVDSTFITGLAGKLDGCEPIEK